MIKIKVKYIVHNAIYTTTIISNQPWQEIVGGIESLGGKIISISMRKVK
jgi:hypothetical protein